MAQNIFFELSMVVVIATLISIVMRLIRQPLIIGYILTGVLVGPFAFDLVKSTDTLNVLSQVGIAFLLFIVGLNLNYRTLKEVGNVALLTGVGQVLFTSVLGYYLGILMGFTKTASIYMGIALSFSSTIIIVKLLSDKQDIETLYGKISVGFLLVQDFIAIIILMALSSPFKQLSLFDLVTATLFKLIAVIAILFVISIRILPELLKIIAKSQELLFLFGIGWVLLLAVALQKLGFTIEIGALFAGITLSSSPFHYEIGSKLKPLRDFFIIMFFIYLGTQLVFGELVSILPAIILFSLFILIGNPLILLVIMGAMGFRKRISFFAGLTVAQISEFSLILVVLGMSLGHVTQDIVSLVTIVGLITIAGSTYMIIYNEKLYGIFARYLTVFERKTEARLQPAQKKEKYNILLFGYNRIGFGLLKSFKKLKKKFLVVDYNPEIISMLASAGVPFQYGDASDSELLDEIPLGTAQMVISTIPQLDTNLLLIKKVRSANSKAVIIATSHQIDDAFMLYNAGADYVIMPHFLGGTHASALIERFGTDINKFIKEKIRHIEELRQRRNFGHEHPSHQ